MRVECKGRRVRFQAGLEELPDGRRILVDRVLFPDSVAVLPVDGDGGIILIRQYRPSTGEWLLEAPAGTIKEGEAPEEAARRELLEEAGLEASELVRVGMGYVSPGYSTEKMTLYIARGLKPGEARPEYYEAIEGTVKLGLDEALTLVEKGEIRDVKTILLLYALKALSGDKE
ncbi:MAG: NUDIX hydrolase [Desulfurococcales archaeon]|nr:NUDIX hydrolase [Desulfurococcales archaeon]